MTSAIPLGPHKWLLYYDMRFPFTLTIKGNTYLCATNHYVIVAVRTDAYDLPPNSSVFIKMATRALLGNGATHYIASQRLADWAGEPDWPETGDEAVVRPGILCGALINRNYLAQLLSKLPEAEVALEKCADRRLLLITRQWRAAIMERQESSLAGIPVFPAIDVEGGVGC